MAKKKTPSYTEAYEELQQISTQLESGEVGIDELSALVQRAKELLVFCQKKLRSTEDSLKQEESE